MTDKTFVDFMNTSKISLYCSHIMLLIQFHFYYTQITKALNLQSMPIFPHTHTDAVAPKCLSLHPVVVGQLQRSLGKGVIVLLTWVPSECFTSPLTFLADSPTLARCQNTFYKSQSLLCSSQYQWMTLPDFAL